MCEYIGGFVVLVFIGKLNEEFQKCVFTQAQAFHLINYYSRKGYLCIVECGELEKLSKGVL